MASSAFRLRLQFGGIGSEAILSAFDRHMLHARQGTDLTAHGRDIRAGGKADDRGMGMRPDAPDMQIADGRAGG